MGPFEPAELPPEAFDVAELMKRHGVDEENAKALVHFNQTQWVFLNETYQVNVREADIPEDIFPPMYHLSIKRIDKQPIHDWRELQEIKIKIVGANHEAVELYPAEGRVTDTANQYHLWVLVKEGQQFPFGFRDGRNIATPEQSAKSGAVQRPFKTPVEQAKELLAALIQEQRGEALEGYCHACWGPSPCRCWDDS